MILNQAYFSSSKVGQIYFIPGGYTGLRWAAIRHYRGPSRTSGTSPGPDARSKELRQVQEHQRRAPADRAAARLRGVLPRVVGGAAAQRPVKRPLFPGPGEPQPRVEAVRLPRLRRRRRRRLNGLNRLLPAQRRPDPHDDHGRRVLRLLLRCLRRSAARERPCRNVQGSPC